MVHSTIRLAAPATKSIAGWAVGRTWLSSRRNGATWPGLTTVANLTKAALTSGTTTKIDLFVSSTGLARSELSLCLKMI